MAAPKKCYAITGNHYRMVGDIIVDVHMFQTLHYGVFHGPADLDALLKCKASRPPEWTEPETRPMDCIVTEVTASACNDLARTIKAQMHAWPIDSESLRVVLLRPTDAS